MALMMGPRGTLFANRAAGCLFAADAGAINGRSVLDVLPAIAPFYTAVLRHTLSGSPIRFEEQAIRLESGGRPSTHWFNLDFTPVQGEDGAIVGVLGVANEVTSLVRRVRDHSDSEQRLKLALEGSGMVGIWTLDIPTGICTADASVSGMFGVPVGEGARGVPVSHYIAAIHPDDRDNVTASIEATVAQGKAYRSRYRLIGSDGRLRWVIASGKPVRNDMGDITRLLGVVVDVTDQMEIATALAESRFQFQTLTEALPQIVWSCDADGRHDYFSARWSEFTGIHPDEITEETWKLLVYPPHQETVNRVWNAALASGETYDVDYRFRHHSGDYRWLRVMAQPIRDGSGKITRWFGTSTDVHDSYRLAEEREELARELERIATEDALTGVLTRRAFFDRVGRGAGQQGAASGPVGLLMLDIDHFKSINDRYGHPVGDKVLAQTVARIGEAIRGHDLLGRLGGEEFAVFLPCCSRAEAAQIAERIRRSVETNRVPLGDDATIQVTLSIGAICVLDDEAGIAELLTRADQALYRAKAGGRNRTVFATD
jgi:diguanylate cyclase (GGDEF)-like protein/PAS domain S-box-containing protein